MQISLLRSLYSRCPTTVGVPNPAHCVPILGSAELEFASVVMQECVELSFMSHGTFLMEIFERFFFLDVQLFCWSAQREGLLSETFHEDAVQADPFYANCKLHTEKSTMRLQSLQFSFYCMHYFDSIASKLNLFETNRRRKSNYLSHQRHLQWWTCKRNAGHDMMNTGSGEDVSLRRILRKLDRQRVKFHTKHWPRATWGKPFFFIYSFVLSCWIILTTYCDSLGFLHILCISFFIGIFGHP